jgi:hypothetical protein
LTDFIFGGDSRFISGAILDLWPLVSVLSLVSDCRVFPPVAPFIGEP